MIRALIKTVLVALLVFAVGVMPLEGLRAARAEALSFGAAATQNLKGDLVGVWQDSPGMAAGWSNTFQFFPDGRFTFNISQMDCAARERSYSGSWSIVRGKLVLRITERTVIEGGRLVQATGSCGSTFEIEDGTVRSRPVSPARSRRLALSRRGVDKYGRLKIRLGGKTYWKFGSDPNEYS